MQDQNPQIQPVQPIQPEQGKSNSKLIWAVFGVVVVVMGLIAGVILVQQPQFFANLAGRGQNKVLICHVPPGNHENAHDIEVARPGWENGHGIHSREPLDFVIDDTHPCPPAAEVITPKPAACLIYGIHDDSAEDTQFFTIDPETLSVNTLGRMYRGYNIESMDLHPDTNILYAVARGGPYANQLIKVDAETGALIPVGPIGGDFDDVVGLSFKPDGTLWGWADEGLVEINIETGDGEIRYSQSHEDKEFTGIAWSNDGQKLYGARNVGSELWVYSSGSGLEKLATNLPGGGQRVEALEMTSNGLLLGGFHGAGNAISIFAYNVDTKQPVASKNIASQFNDVEAIAWPDFCKSPILSLDFDKEFSSNLDTDGSGNVSVGDTLTYSFVATNTGTEELTNVTIADSLDGLSALTCTPQAPATLAPGATLSCTATYVVTVADATSGSIDNTATASSDEAPDASDSENVSVQTVVPSIELVKELSSNADEDDSGGVSEGDTLTYSFVATNTGLPVLTNVVITDPLTGLGPLACTPQAPATLASQETLSCTATYVVTVADADEGAIENTATATSDQVQDTDGENVTVHTESPLVAVCLDVRMYDTDWNRISSDEFANLLPGDTVRFTVHGSANRGQISKARFTVNGVVGPEVTDTQPDPQNPDVELFFYEYTFAEGVTEFSVKGEIFHEEYGSFF